MRSGRTVGLWVAAAVMLVATVGLYLWEPDAGTNRFTQDDREQLDAAIAKAATYYEFGHYERAVESYETAIERGMNDALQWYRYAHATELSGGDYLHAYARAYELLLRQESTHEYLAEAEAVLRDEAVDFEFRAFQEGEQPPGTLVALEGTVSRVVWGRVESNTDRLFVATREDDWLGHSGEEILVVVPRHRRFRPGDTVFIAGFYTGRCMQDMGSGVAREYLCLEAAGARLLGP